MPSRPPSGHRRRRATIACGAATLLALGAVAPAQGDLQGRIADRQASARTLEAAIAAESRRIQATNDGLAQARRRLAALQAREQARRSELQRVQRDLLAARERLTRLENRMRVSSAALARSLVAAYEGDRPDLASVVLEARGFADLLERLDFAKRISREDAQILRRTRTSRRDVLRETNRLDALERRVRRLAAQAASARDEAAAVQGALLQRRAAELRGRAGAAGALAGVRSQLASLKARRAREIRAAQAAARRLAAAPAAGAPTPNASIPVDTGGMAQAPPGAPAAVRQVIAAGNAIATLPYLYGGGHASFHASAYDCSGSVSYALAAAGLVSSPLDSTAFESWGEPGPGRWITVYANAGHAFMVVAGWRFDTVALAEGGTRWTRSMTSTAGFVARHPAGL